MTDLKEGAHELDVGQGLCVNRCGEKRQGYKQFQYDCRLALLGCCCSSQVCFAVGTGEGAAPYIVSISSEADSRLQSHQKRAVRHHLKADVGSRVSAFCVQELRSCNA